jgi:predicted nuclease with TOPRIM domain
VSFFNEISAIVQGVIVPELKAIKVTLDGLGKDVDRLIDDNKDLEGKYDRLNERLSRLEGLFVNLEPTLKAYIDNSILKSLPSPNK